jgi:hypothetical protein
MLKPWKEFKNFSWILEKSRTELMQWRKKTKKIFSKRIKNILNHLKKSTRLNSKNSNSQSDYRIPLYNHRIKETEIQSISPKSGS